MNNKIAISQSNFIPWKGYFDLIASVDAFVIYDEMQFTKRDWRNRNKIKTRNGTQWISVPVNVKGKFAQKINETQIADPDWGKKAWKTLENNYNKTKYFDLYREQFEKIFYLQEPNLSKLNMVFIKEILKILGVKTRIYFSKNFELHEDRNLRLVNICKKLEASIYVSGPSAQAYMDTKLFEDENIGVEWFDYSNYQEYDQQYGQYEHHVSILDLLFNEGPNSKDYLKYVG